MIDLIFHVNTIFMILYRIKHSHTNKGTPDLTDPKKKSS
jgi:hypothetical protein